MVAARCNRYAFEPLLAVGERLDDTLQRQVSGPPAQVLPDCNHASPSRSFLGLYKVEGSKVQVRYVDTKPPKVCAPLWAPHVLVALVAAACPLDLHQPLLLGKEAWRKVNAQGF